MTGMEPINQGGVVNIYGGSTYAWQRLRDLVTVPPEATAMTVEATINTGMLMFSPEEMPNYPYPGIEHRIGTIAFWPGADALQNACVLDTDAALTIIFYQGPVTRPSQP